MPKSLLILAIPLLLIAAACGDDDAAPATSAPATTVTPAPSPTTSAPSTTAAPAPTTSAPSTTAAPVTTAAPAMAPAEVVFEAQTSDGSSIVVASVTLPAPGYIAVHGNNDGGPGPVIGHSELLPAGTSTNVTVALDVPLTATDLVFPMAHIDVDGDGVYEFFPPDDTVDGPALTAAGSVAVVGAEVTVEAATAAGATITIAGFDFGDPITVAAGDTVTVRNTDGVDHTWTSTEGLFDSGSLSKGEEFSFTFDEPGEYAFVCQIHPVMAGSITVTG